MSGEQWEVPGYFKAGQHGDNMGIWGRTKAVFRMVWKRKVMNGKVAKAVRDVR